MRRRWATAPVSECGRRLSHRRFENTTKCALTLLLLRLTIFRAKETGSGSRKSYEEQAAPKGQPCVDIDKTVLKNVFSYWEGARARVDFPWDGSSSDSESVASQRFLARPLMATVDRRPATLRRQFLVRPSSKHIGCAISTNTMVTGLGFIDVSSFKSYEHQAACHACFEFASVTYAVNFLSEMASREVQYPSTVCIPGVVDLHQRFAAWQKGSRPPDKAYPWTVDCVFPGGFSELSCSGLSALNDDRPEALQRIFVRTNFTLITEKHPNAMHVISFWPWNALRSHDDERQFLDSVGRPKSASELNLAYFQGPNYETDAKDGKSLRTGVGRTHIKGGAHRSLVTQLLQLSLGAKGTTAYMGVPDGQVHSTLAQIEEIIRASIQDIIPTFSGALSRAYEEMQKSTGGSHHKTSLREVLYGTAEEPSTVMERLTVEHFMRIQRIQLRIVPLPTPALAFERLLISGQYAFNSYIAARYSADHHALMYFDGDAVPLVMSHLNQSLIEIMYQTLYGAVKSCRGVQFSLIELSIPQHYSSPDDVFRCIKKFYEVSDDAWDLMYSTCKQSYGNILARSDEVRSMSVHYVDTFGTGHIEGTVECTGLDILQNSSIELHMTMKKRPAHCTCDLSNI